MRATTWMKRTPLRESQMRGPEAWVGGGVVEGMRER